MQFLIPSADSIICTWSESTRANQSLSPESSAPSETMVRVPRDFDPMDCVDFTWPPAVKVCKGHNDSRDGSFVAHARERSSGKAHGGGGGRGVLNRVSHALHTGRVCIG